MNRMSKDGGPAFPAPYTTSGAYPGMSLRDWFAGQALMGLLAGRQNNYDHADIAKIIHEAGCLADAMLKERGDE